MPSQIAVPREITEALSAIKSGIVRNGDGLLSLENRTDEFENLLADSQRTASRLRKQTLNVSPQFTHPSRSMVSERLARFIGAVTILGANNLGRLDHLGEEKRRNIVGVCRYSLASFPDAAQRSALTSADIPLPTEFSAELIALVETYGTARKYGTVYAVGGHYQIAAPGQFSALRLRRYVGGNR